MKHYFFEILSNLLSLFDKKLWSIYIPNLHIHKILYSCQIRASLSRMDCYVLLHSLLFLPESWQKFSNKYTREFFSKVWLMREHEKYEATWNLGKLQYVICQDEYVWRKKTLMNLGIRQMSRAVIMSNGNKI